MKNWFRGEILGDGKVRPKKRYIEWCRTISVSKANPLWRQLVESITKHPKALKSKLTNGLKLAQGYVPLEIDEKIRLQYIPRMLKGEMDLLVVQDIYPNIYYTVNYYLKTRRITITWSIYVANEEAVKLARFLEFSRTPWNARKIRKLVELEKFNL